MEIQIAKIYPPKQAGWSARIKDNLGQYFGVRAEIAETLREGQVINADIRTKEKDGATYRDIIKIHDGGASPAKAATAPATSNGRYAAHDDATAERIFVCGVVNAVAPKIYEKLGTIDSDKLSALVQVARVTWTATLGRKEGV